jgi:hypothetical protein
VSVVLLSARRERRRILREEINRVVELNHRLRNALQVITDSDFGETVECSKKNDLRHSSVDGFDIEATISHVRSRAPATFSEDLYKGTGDGNEAQGLLGECYSRR